MVPDDSPREAIGEDGLKLASFCALCDTRRTPLSVRILGSDMDSHLVHVTCRKCKGSTLCLVLKRADTASSVSIVTDLSPDDVGRFERARAVSVDDVIAAHEFFSSAAWEKMAKGAVPPRKAKQAVKHQR
jgi:hypothetical protein